MLISNSSLFFVFVILRSFYTFIITKHTITLKSVFDTVLIIYPLLGEIHLKDKQKPSNRIVTFTKKTIQCHFLRLFLLIHAEPNLRFTNQSDITNKTRVNSIQLVLFLPIPMFNFKSILEIHSIYVTRSVEHFALVYAPRSFEHHPLALHYEFI